MKTENEMNYYSNPVRLVVRTKTGKRAYLTGYAAIQRARDQGRLIAAYSTSTGKVLA